MLDMSFSVQDLEYFLLIFVRITCFVLTAPFFSTANVPQVTKTGFSFFVSMLLYQFVVPHDVLVYNTVLGYSVLVIKEAIVGVLVGLGCNIVIAILTFAGKIMDMEVGLSMVNIYDPTTRTNEGFSGMFYHYLVLLVLILSGMHHYLLRALVELFKVVPTGRIVIGYDKFLPAAVSFLGDYISIGFRICLPVFAAMLMVNVILGILAKVAPQMNMFAVGMQIKIIIGLSLMFLTIGMLPGMSNLLYAEIKKMMVTMTGVFS